MTAYQSKRKPTACLRQLRHSLRLHSVVSVYQTYDSRIWCIAGFPRAENAARRRRVGSGERETDAMHVWLMHS